MGATGWLPHTSRAALTGLRKRGFAVALDRSDKERGSIYRIEKDPNDRVAAALPTDAAEPNSEPASKKTHKAGALLVREWKGRLERVMVLERGFAWNGKSYRSLSQVAKAMTGTSWNGHRFFGLQTAGPDRSAMADRRSGDCTPQEPAPNKADQRRRETWSPGESRHGGSVMKLARGRACAAPSIPASRPSTGWSKSSIRSTTSGKPQKPISRAKPTKAGG